MALSNLRPIDERSSACSQSPDPGEHHVIIIAFVIIKSFFAHQQEACKVFKKSCFNLFGVTPRKRDIGQFLH